MRLDQLNHATPSNREFGNEGNAWSVCSLAVWLLSTLSFCRFKLLRGCRFSGCLGLCMSRVSIPESMAPNFCGLRQSRRIGNPSYNERRVSLKTLGYGCRPRFRAF
jgi:hypothetical protein